jgi:hypothetical protein
MAAAVAEATIGLASDWHAPNGIMLTRGLWSMILAAGTKLVMTRLTGKTMSELGAIPKLHFNIAPMQTFSDIETS